MPVLLVILAALGASAFWYYRPRRAGQADRNIVDAAQRALSGRSRPQFGKKADGSAITGIDDPVVGAVVMMVATCLERGPLSPATEAGILHEMQTVMGVAKISEPYAYAKWAVQGAANASDVENKLSGLWMEKLDHQERADLLAMVSSVAALDGPLTPAQTAVLQKLGERLTLA